MDIPLSDTMFVVAHFHMVMGVAPILVVLGAIYHWYPKITGRMLDEGFGKIHFWVTFIGVNLTFFPMHFLGLAGMPRRYVDYPDAFAGWNMVASIGSYIGALGAIIFLVVIVEAFVKKRKASKNPWGSTDNTLEWTVSSPPAFHTFAEIPKVK